MGFFTNYPFAGVARNFVITPWNPTLCDNLPSRSIRTHRAALTGCPRSGGRYDIRSHSEICIAHIRRWIAYPCSDLLSCFAAAQSNALVDRCRWAPRQAAPRMVAWGANSFFASRFNRLFPDWVSDPQPDGEGDLGANREVAIPKNPWLFTLAKSYSTISG